jgi:TolA-binding protein
MTFFKHLKESLSESAVQGQRKKGRVGSVAAVRGESQVSALADPNEPVLKGDPRAKKDKLAAAEDSEFAKAVDFVLAGKVEEGVKALQEFTAKYPKSRNLDKVQQAINQAKELTPPVESVKPETAKPSSPAAL